MSYYGAFLDLRGRLCAVLGGSLLAAEKAQGLLDAGARVIVFTSHPSPELLVLTTAITGRATDSLALVPRDYQPGDLRGTWLAIDASEDARIHAAAFAEAERAHVLLNVVDRPEQCGFIAPALVRRGSLQIAISTSGESPFVASAVRSMIERLIGHEWGPFVALVGQVRRELRARGVPRRIQLGVYRELLASNVRESLRTGDNEAAEATLDGILAECSSQAA